MPLRSFKYSLLFALISLLTWPCYSQNDQFSKGIKTHFHYGFVIPHHGYMAHLTKGHTKAVEFNFYKLTNGDNDWERTYRYPKTGFSTIIIDLANKENFGTAVGLYPFVDFPLNERKIKWHLKFGYGLGFIEKNFNRESNYKNLAIGSKLNILIQFNNQFEMKINDHLNTSLGFSFTHFSNGSFKIPNLGINIPALNAGVAYHFGELQSMNTSDITNREKKWNKYVLGNIGFKEIAPIEGPKYPIASLSYNSLRNITNKSSVGVGADLFYNSSLTKQMEKDSVSTDGGLNNVRAGLAFIYSMDVGKISYQLHMGAYPYTKFKGQGYLYHRIVSRYMVNDHAFLNLSLKTHFAVADFIELGVGYKLP